ncbi:hypothetical protein [Roseivirga sp.]|uniref:hypothetical protein n=1 Tax=Roseivirga sp. TaxID=1964215 RepID=UPI003B5187C6
MGNGGKNKKLSKIGNINIFNLTKEELENAIKQSERDFEDKRFIDAYSLLKKYQ